MRNVVVGSPWNNGNTPIGDRHHPLELRMSVCVCVCRNRRANYQKLAYFVSAWSGKILFHAITNRWFSSFFSVGGGINDNSSVFAPK